MTCSTTNKQQAPCPLCNTPGAFFYHSDKRRNYHQCAVCDLVFVTEEFHLSPEAEKKEYDLHENNPEDSGYRKFLSRLAIPMQDHLAAGMTGLDFGCGPGPALAAIFTEAGFDMATYDPFYCPDEAVLDKQYNFVTCTETIEHFSNPDKEIEKLFDLLKPNGILGIMTKLVRNQEAFKTWHYINDPTHISFFSRETFQWIAKKYNAECEFIGNDIIILTARQA